MSRKEVKIEKKVVFFVFLISLHPSSSSTPSEGSLYAERREGVRMGNYWKSYKNV